MADACGTLLARIPIRRARFALLAIRLFIDATTLTLPPLVDTPRSSLICSAFNGNPFADKLRATRAARPGVFEITTDLVDGVNPLSIIACPKQDPCLMANIAAPTELRAFMFC